MIPGGLIRESSLNGLTNGTGFYIEVRLMAKKIVKTDKIDKVVFIVNFVFCLNRIF